MKKLSYYIMLLGIVFFTSCEDFLDQVPKHNLTLAEFNLQMQQNSD